MKTWIKLVLLGLLPVVVARADLFEYVARPEPEFRWEQRSVTNTVEGSLTELHFVSQVWQGLRWEHTLLIYRPIEARRGRAAILLIAGDGPGQNRGGTGYVLAKATGAIVAELFNIPNQPLFGGLKEDALVAYTFDKMIDTHDATWPVLLPMTKAAVKAMDVVTAFTDQQWHEKIGGFVVSGASKRGWTTWLTAVVDPRVRGIAPMVYDNLNVPKQMSHQLATWGAYSDSIKDYTHRQLQPKLATEQGKLLTQLVDPYVYRARLTLPKLIINGSNDPYWTIDALNFYWDDLGGEKHVLYVPNAGHNHHDDRQRDIHSLVACYRHVADDAKFPALTWSFTTNAAGLRLQASPDVPPREAVLWSAQSATKDFRPAQWRATPLLRDGDAFIGEIPTPTNGWTAVFGELSFDQSGKPYSLSTAPRIIGPP